MSPAGLARVGVDVGGTFTDLVLTDRDGAIHTRKLPSTPEDFSTGVADGVRQVLGLHAVDPAHIRDVVHGSTVATNAILERRGARTGLLTTAGFRDVLELRRLRMPKLYDMTWQKPAPLVERRLRLEVGERVDLDGSVVRPLDLAEAARAVERPGGRGRRVDRGQPDPRLRQPGPRARDRRAARGGATPTSGCRCRTRSCRSSASTSGPARPCSTPTCSRPSRRTCSRCGASSTAPGSAARC